MTKHNLYIQNKSSVFFGTLYKLAVLIIKELVNTARRKFPFVSLFFLKIMFPAKITPPATFMFSAQHRRINFFIRLILTGAVIITSEFFLTFHKDYANFNLFNVFSTPETISL